MSVPLGNYTKIFIVASTSCRILDWASVMHTPQPRLGFNLTPDLLQFPACFDVPLGTLLDLWTAYSTPKHISWQPTSPSLYSREALPM